LHIEEELGKLGVLKDEHYQDDRFLQNRFLTHRLIAQWYKNPDAGCSEMKQNATGSLPTGCRPGTRIPGGLTRSMYPMGQLDFHEEPDEVGFVEYEFKEGNFCPKGSETPIDWDKNKLAQEITVVFSTNHDGFILKRNKKDDEITYDISRQHLDNDGQIKRNTSPSGGLNNAILDILEELVDTTKVKIQFQFCNH